MIRARLPTPLRGWRAFAGEVGIVVLGVLIALGVDQAAETVSNARDASDARAAVRAEVITNISRVKLRLTAQACVDHRLDELRAVLEEVSPDERLQRPNWIGRPPRLAIESQRWDAASQSGRTSYFDPDEQARFGFLYTTLAYYYEMQNGEQLAWSRLSALQGVDRLSDDGRLAMHVALGEARFYATSIRQITPILFDEAKQMRLTPTDRIDRPATVCWPTNLSPAEAQARLNESGHPQ